MLASSTSSGSPSAGSIVALLITKFSEDSKVRIPVVSSKDGVIGIGDSPSPKYVHSSHSEPSYSDSKDTPATLTRSLSPASGAVTPYSTVATSVGFNN